MNMNLFSGKLIRLSSEDPQVLAEAFTQWSNDSEYLRLLDTDPPRAWSVTKRKQWLEKDLENPERNYLFSIHTLAGDRLIGFIGLGGIHWTNGDAWVGIGIGDREYWGKGYGREAMSLILCYAFTELNLHRVSLGVFSYNTRAIRAYEKCGFRKEGIIRQSFRREGQRWDEITMGILQNEWLAKNNSKTSLTVSVPGAPALPGLSFRGYRDGIDFEKMAAVIQGCKQFDQMERTDTAEEIARNYRHAPNFDITKDLLFVEINNEVVGYYRVMWYVEDNGDAIYTHYGFLLPEWRGKGIGRAVLAHLQAHIRTIAAVHPAEQPKYFQSYADEKERDATAFLLAAGYQPIRHFYTMVRPDLEKIPDLPLPPGFEIRPVQEEYLPLIIAASSEAFRDHWGYSAATEPTLEEIREDPDFDPSLWRVAWKDDQVAGMVLSYITGAENQEYKRLRGYTENICVRRPYRKQGLARSLIAASLWALRERGMQEAALHVDTENLSGALRLYESIGFQPVARHSTYRKPV